MSDRFTFPQKITLAAWLGIAFTGIFSHPLYTTLYPDSEQAVIGELRSLFSECVSNAANDQIARDNCQILIDEFTRCRAEDDTSFRNCLTQAENLHRDLATPTPY